MPEETPIYDIAEVYKRLEELEKRVRELEAWVPPQEILPQ